MSAYACFLKSDNEVGCLVSMAAEAYFQIYRALVNMYWNPIPASSQLTQWCSTPSTDFVIEAFNYEMDENDFWSLARLLVHTQFD